MIRVLFFSFSFCLSFLFFFCSSYVLHCRFCFIVHFLFVVSFVWTIFVRIASSSVLCSFVIFDLFFLSFYILSCSSFLWPFSFTSNRFNDIQFAQLELFLSSLRVFRSSYIYFLNPGFLLYSVGFYFFFVILFYFFFPILGFVYMLFGFGFLSFEKCLQHEHTSISQ